MNKYLTSFGGTVKGFNRHMASYHITRDYTREVKRLFTSAVPYNIQCLYYDDNWLLNSKYMQNENTKKVIATDSYGWCFKPIIIKECLDQIKDGEGLLWLDSNHCLVDNPDILYEYAKKFHIFCHDHWCVIYPNIDWTTKDMFVRTGCDEPEYHNAPQMQVNIMCFYKDDVTMQFVNEWVNYATDYDTMIANVMPNYFSFREPRHEQSLFSLLRVRYGIPYFPEPYQVVRELMGIDVNE